MTTRDWPTDDAFKAATPFQLALDSSQSTARGFYTGNTQRLGHADRLRMTVMLPPTTSRAAAAKREAFFMSLLSTGDVVRLAMPHRKYINGDLTGSPTVAASVAAGARSLVLTGGVGVNLLPNPSFERATLAPWTRGGTGSHTATRSTDTFVVDGHSMAVVNTVTGQDAYYEQTVACLPSTTYTLSAFVFVQSIAGGALSNRSMLLYDGSTTAEDLTLNTSHALSTWTLKQLTFNTGSSASTLNVRLYAPNGGIYWDVVQLVKGPALPYFASAPTLLPGDIIGVGGNLLMVGPDGSSRNADDDILVPLAMPVPKAITAGAAATVVAPTGLWQLDVDGLQLDYSAGSLQGGVAIPLRQYIA